MSSLSALSALDHDLDWEMKLVSQQWAVGREAYIVMEEEEDHV